MGSDDAVGEVRGSATGRTWTPFGDPVGLAVFLGTLALVGATWQVGVFITDTYAVANGLVNLAHGHLAVERVPYGLTLDSQPGLSVAGGKLYARNYGQAFLALPLYYALDLTATVVELHLMLVTAWALVAAAFCRQVGAVLGRRKQFRTVGSVLAALLVVASVPLVEPLDDGRAGLVALQVLSMLAVAATALAVYRLGSFVRGQRVGVAAGVGTALATPLWFWAAIPKRHALTVAAVAILLFWFAASREPAGRAHLPVVGSVPRALALRVAGYALVGIVAWVHAFEGVVLLGAFAVADLATASATSRRALAALAVGAGVGFAPFFATNLAVSGNPLEPPRLQPSYQEGDDFEIGPGGEVVGPGKTANESLSTSASEGGTGTSEGGTGASVLGSVASFAGAVASHGSSILATADTAPQRLYRTYLRSGRPGEYANNELNKQEAINLSLLESNPLLGGLLGVVAGSLVAAAGSSRRVRRRRTGVRSLVSRTPRSPGELRRRIRGASPARRTDTFALAVFAAFGVTYFPRLPLASQLTVRYLLPVVPALLYLVVRVPAVADAVETRPRLLAGSYVAFVAAGTLVVALGVPRLDPAVGEAMQIHALANLGAGGVAAACVLAHRAGITLDTRVRAVGLALAGAATTVLVVFMQLAYFEYGVYALPLARLVADSLTVLS